MRFLKKDHMLWTAAASAGFSLFLITSHPKSKVHDKIKPRKIKNVYLLPHIKVEFHDREYHLHHWINLSSLLLLLYSARRRRLLGSRILRAFVMGGIVQGLCYKDRFTI